MLWVFIRINQIPIRILICDNAPEWNLHNSGKKKNHLTKAILINTYSIIELQHDKTNKVACAPSEDSDQPGHTPSLIRAFVLRSIGRKGSTVFHADSEDSDQTGQMPRLI